MPKQIWQKELMSDRIHRRAPMLSLTLQGRPRGKPAGYTTKATHRRHICERERCWCAPLSSLCGDWAGLRKDARQTLDDRSACATGRRKALPIGRYRTFTLASLARAVICWVITRPDLAITLPRPPETHYLSEHGHVPEYKTQLIYSIAHHQYRTTSMCQRRGSVAVQTEELRHETTTGEKRK